MNSMLQEYAMHKLLISLILFFLSQTSYAQIQSKEVTYHVNGIAFTGYLAFDDAIKGKRPGILVVHEWWGHSDYARKRADMLAALGYTAFALDMYGSGKQANHPDDAKKFMMAVMGDKEVMTARFQAGLDLLLAQANVYTSKTAVIGYCMGGGIALNMARSGLNVDGIAVFHGSLGTQTPVRAGQIKAQIAVFTGGADPFVPAAQVQAFQAEMKAAGVSYSLKVYPDAQHAFTNPEADRFGQQFSIPLSYNKDADLDSWSQLESFLHKLFQ
jgi:dienelactone hydrolase